MGQIMKFLSRLSPGLRESLETLAQDEHTSVEDLLVVAIAEKIARREHSVWLTRQRPWAGTAAAARRAQMEQDAGELPRANSSSHVTGVYREEEIERNRLADVFDGVPVFLAILSGPDHIFDVVNPSYRDLVGKRELIGKRVADCFPELAGTVWMDRLNHVYQTGEPLVQRGARLSLAPAEGQPLQDKFVDYAYKPRRASDGTIYGIIVLGVDTTLVQRVLGDPISDVGVIELLS